MLHIHRAERADRLADGLAATLLDPLEDPFAAEVIAVPTRGIERWLTQRLSTRLGAGAEGRADGVCANVEFPFPGRLILGSLAAASGIEPDEDPWLPERSVWPLLEVVDDCLDEPWLVTLKRHLEGARAEPEDPPRRFSVVRHVADLFDRYGVQRPDMVRSWAVDVASPGEEEWQPELWRRLRARIGSASPAERLRPACDRIRNRPELLPLPRRLALFGLTRLPRSYLEVLSAIAAHRDAHLFVLHPSPVLWKEVQKMEVGVVKSRGEDPTAELPRNRLLASWGRDARELQVVLAACADETRDHHEEQGTAEPGTLLGRIQADIRADRRPAADGALAGADDSIEVHACHGRARQVEVLRDAILHLLQDDPTLEPRDVIVMCPDIETFAPLIQATFGAGPAAAGERPERHERPERPERPEHPERPDLRVRLADRSLRQTNPVLGVVSQLLALADQRATASQLLDLASTEPVRRRFGFDDDDLARIQDWVAQSGIRWGFDAAHRGPFKLERVGANTWRRGLDRILVGVTTAGERGELIGGVLPLDDVESGAIELAGRMAEYVDRARAVADALARAKPIAQWTSAIADAADALTATSERDQWQRRELDRLLANVLGESQHDGDTPELELADVRALLADRLRGRPTRANFRTGHLTVCTLVPMRSVPHRVVCMLGLDDGEFPRRAHRDGDDLMLHDPFVGDRSPRTEDRQMLLDALMAAGERLIVTYTGHDERTNLRRPPAVPLGELLDTIERTAGAPARERVVRSHPLQPFDPRNFVPGRPWGFDREALGGARALTGPRTQPPPFLREPLAPAEQTVVELERLIRFVERPVRTLLRDRLGIGLGERFEEVEDAIPVELDALEEWGVGQRLLDGVLGGAALDDCMVAEQARGGLPPGELARAPLVKIKGIVEQIAAEAERLALGAPGSLDVNVALPSGRRLTGTVAGVHGDTVRSISYSRVRPRERLRAWVRLLALTAARPEHPYQSVILGRSRPDAYDGQVTVVRAGPLGDDDASRAQTAAHHLQVLIDLYDRGMREPLPLACDTSAAYAEAGEAAARKAWTSPYGFDKEDRDPEHLRIYGAQVDFGDLLADRPRADERWDPDERSRFGQYAHRMWDGLLEHEAVEDR